MNSISRLLFPDPVRELPHARAWNIALRTAHIAVTGILLGGHVFDVAEERLLLLFYLTILTGVGLVAVEAYPSCRWLFQGRGLLVFAKLALLCLVPWLWEYRVPLLLAVVVIASVGSHMPSRFRYYSFLELRVLEVPQGQPGWQPQQGELNPNPHTAELLRVTTPHTQPPTCVAAAAKEVPCRKPGS